MEKLVYTYFWKRMPIVFMLDRCPAGANHQKQQPEVSCKCETKRGAQHTACLGLNYISENLVIPRAFWAQVRWRRFPYLRFLLQEPPADSHSELSEGKRSTSSLKEAIQSTDHLSSQAQTWKDRLGWKESPGLQKSSWNAPWGPNGVTGKHRILRSIMVYACTWFTLEAERQRPQKRICQVTPPILIKKMRALGPILEDVESLTPGLLLGNVRGLTSTLMYAGNALSPSAATQMRITMFRARLAVDMNFAFIG